MLFPSLSQVVFFGFNEPSTRRLEVVPIRTCDISYNSSSMIPRATPILSMRALRETWGNPHPPRPTTSPRRAISGSLQQLAKSWAFFGC